MPQLALLVAIPLHLASKAYQDPSPSVVFCAIADLAVIAFYFLLRVGEYTKPKYANINGVRVHATCMVKFTVGDIGFFKDGKQLLCSTPLETLLHAEYASMSITNQKNGCMGQVITHQTILDAPHGPVQALARQVSYILSHGGTDDTLL